MLPVFDHSSPNQHRAVINNTWLVSLETRLHWMLRDCEMAETESSAYNHVIMTRVRNYLGLKMVSAKQN